MSYTPTNWDNGDVITAAKLNKIEQGISEALSSSGGSGSGANIVVCPLDITYDDGGAPIFTAQMTAGELYAADGIYFVVEGAKFPCADSVFAPGEGAIPDAYVFSFIDIGTDPLTVISLTATSANAYPSSNGGSSSGGSGSEPA